MSTQNPSLFERIGGKAAVNAAVDDFYQRVLADERIARFFAGVDMKAQSAKQKGFLTQVFGGPTNYTGKQMREGHAHLLAMGLDDSHVDAVIEDLGATLNGLGVAEADIKEVAAIAESVRDEVLGR